MHEMTMGPSAEGSRRSDETFAAPRARRRRLALSGSLALVVLSLAPAALAQSDDDDILAPAEPAPTKADAPAAKRVGLVPLLAVGDATKPLAEQVTERLKKELTDGKLVVESLSLAPKGASAPSDAGADAAKKALATAAKEQQKAKKLLGQMQLGRAEPAFQKAIAEYRSAAAVLENVDALVETHLGLAEVFARQGMEDEANAELAAAAVLHPELALDTSVYPPQFIRSFQKLRDRALAGDKGSIFVDETARGATIFVGPKAVGTAPLRINDVPAGTHFVRLELTGVGTKSMFVDVESGLEATVSGGFFASGGTSPEDLLAANQLDGDSILAIAGAAKEAGVDVAVVGVVGKKRSTVPVALVAVLPNGAATRLPQLDFDGDLLNLAIETLKAKEGITSALAASSLPAFEAGVLLEGMKVGVVEVAAITLRYDVVATAAEPKKERKQRVAGAEPDDDEGRKILAGGSGNRKRTLRTDEDRLSTRAPRAELTTEAESDSVLTNPWLWVGVGTGTAAVVAVVATGAAVAIWYFILPPTSAEVSVVLPE